MKEEWLVFKGMSEQFSLAMEIRTRVFVEEQKVPIELERDEYDRLATHILLFVDGRAVATGRFFPESAQPEVLRLGRVAVLQEYRGLGLGRRVVLELLRLARETSAGHEILIHAQQHLAGWYESLGFKARGEEFMEAGIRHQEMLLRLE